MQHLPRATHEDNGGLSQYIQQTRRIRTRYLQQVCPRMLTATSCDNTLFS